MKALTVDFDLIVQSMRDLCRETTDYFLDVASGKVVGLSRNLIRSLAEERAEQKDLPEWDMQMIPIARQVILSANSNYIRIPEAFGRPEHRWMIDFSKEISNLKLKHKLLMTLRGRGSCDRFKEILKDYPDEYKRWLSFYEKRWEEMIQKWLEGIGILAISGNPRKVRSEIR